MAYSIAEGLAGPAQSIMSTNAIWMTLCTVIFDGQSLSILQFLGMFSGITGAFIIAMGDQIVAKLTSKNDKATKVQNE